MKETLSLLKSRFSKDLKSNILLLRHGESRFNLENNKLNEIRDKTIYELTKKSVKFSEKLFDCDLTELGAKQSRNSAHLLRNINIKYIFVSPLRRALNTCLYFLDEMEIIKKDQINYNKPKIMVHPIIYERFEDNGDYFLTDFNHKKLKYSSYDWSLFDKIEDLPYYYLKFCDNFINEEGKLLKTNSETDLKKITVNDNYYCRLLKNQLDEGKKNDFGKIYLREIEKLDKLKTFIESSESIFNRNKILNNFLSEYSKKLSGNETILVIGHSIFFKYLTLLNYRTEEIQTGNFAYLNNCEVISYYI